MPQLTCPNCGSEDLESYEIETGTAYNGHTTTGCAYCIKNGKIQFGDANNRPCPICGALTDTEACSPGCARILADEAGWAVCDTDTGTLFDPETASADGPQTPQRPPLVIEAS